MLIQNITDISNNNPSEKVVFFWNIAGSMCSAVSSLIFLLIVTRICGSYLAGMFAIAFANAQLMLTIGRYGMRSYQATDIEPQFKFQTYFTSRLITCFAMLLVCITYIYIIGFEQDKALIILWVCLLKMVDAVEDVFHGLFHQRNRLDIAGIMLAIRNVLSMLVFLAVLLFTKNLLLTCIVTTIFSFTLCLIMNVPFAIPIINVRLDFSWFALKRLLIECFPLFSSTFLSLYIYNVPKYAIDSFLIADFQTFYGILFMPSFVINLFSEFAFKPILPTIAEMWHHHKTHQLLLKFLNLLRWIVLLTVIIMIGGYFFGIPILSFIYGVDLSEYKIVFLLLLLSGGFGASAWLLNNILTAMRKQKILLLGYLISAMTTSLVSPYLVYKFQIEGAALAYLCSVIILSGLFICCFYNNINKKDLAGER